MKTATLIAITLAAPAAAFSGSSFTGSSVQTVQKNSANMSMEYIPRYAHASESCNEGMNESG